MSEHEPEHDEHNERVDEATDTDRDDAQGPVDPAETDSEQPSP